MNERQAKNQYRLSHGMPLGQDSIGASPEEYGFDQTEEDSGKESRVTKSNFILLIFVGLFLDIIAIVPIVGWFLSSITLIFIYYKIGIKFHLKNILKFGACDLVKIVPGLSLIPAFVLSVILNVGPVVEGVEDMIPAGEKIMHTVQKALSFMKK